MCCTDGCGTTPASSASRRDASSTPSTTRSSFRRSTAHTRQADPHSRSRADQVLDIEEVDPFDLTQFGRPAADRVPIVGPLYLIAQKLHACTESLDGRDNPRVRDLIDLQLVQPLLDDADLPRIRQACRAIFTARDTHPWPPTLAIPPAWPAAYARLADEQANTQLAPAIEDAARSVEALVARVEASVAHAGRRTVGRHRDAFEILDNAEPMTTTDRHPPRRQRARGDSLQLTPARGRFGGSPE